MLKHLTTILFAALLMVGFSTLNAADMKCGAGKCGSTMTKDMTPKGCDKCKTCPNPDCAAKKDPSKPCDCPVDAQGNMKCGAGKCGTKMPKETMKCGAGKCGTN